MNLKSVSHQIQRTDENSDVNPINYTIDSTIELLVNRAIFESISSESNDSVIVITISENTSSTSALVIREYLDLVLPDPTGLWQGTIEVRDTSGNVISTTTHQEDGDEPERPIG